VSGGVGGGGGTRWRGGAAAVANTAVCGLQNAARHRSKWPAAAAAALFVDVLQRKRAKFKTVHAQEQTPRRFLKVASSPMPSVGSRTFFHIFSFFRLLRARARRSLSGPQNNAI